MRTRNIIIALFTAGTLFVSTGVAFAHGHGGKRMDVDKRVEKMTERLDLDAAQAAKVKTILEGAKADFQALRKTEGEPTTKREQAKLIRQSTRAEIDAVLTPAQLEMASELREKRKEKKGRRGHRKHAKAKMMRALDLDDSQKASVKQIRQAARADIQKIVEEDFGGDRRAARDAVKERRLKMRTDIKAELTPEQAEKFAKLEARAKDRKAKRGKGPRGSKNRGK